MRQLLELGRGPDPSWTAGGRVLADQVYVCCVVRFCIVSYQVSALCFCFCMVFVLFLER